MHNPHSAADVWEGGAFHPKFADGRASGEIRIEMDALRFSSVKGELSLPLHGLRLEAGGASDRLIFFKHDDQAQAVIHTADRRILEHPIWTQNAALASQCKSVKGRRRMVRVVTIGTLCGLLLVLAMIYGFRGFLVETAARALPVEWEIQMGDMLFKQMMMTERLVQDDELSAQLARITDPLVTGIDDKRYPLKFHIVEDASLNAFAMPGGNVILHSGLLLAAESPEEVAGVLAHEIAHVQQRHGIRGILSSTGLFLVVQSLLGDVSGILAVLTDNGSLLLSRSFSRDFEREADDYGWHYLVDSEIRPDGMIRFFERMRDEERKVAEKLKEVAPVEVDGGALQLVSTHPATQERIDRLQQKWRQLPGDKIYHTFDLNYAVLQNNLREKLHSSHPDR